MNIFSLAYPSKEERQHLARFYWSSLASEFLNVILPFQFVYLLLVFEKPSWAPIPLMVESLVVFFMEIPTGVLADKWGRKASTILGDTLSALGWLLIPLTAATEGPMQLGIACLAFAMEGLGQTMVSGAEQAWVMDNLIAVEKEHLIEPYFARERSIGSLGGIFSGIGVWTFLLLVPIDSGSINALWYISAFGQFLSVLLVLKVPELEPPDPDRTEEEYGILASGPSRSGAVSGFKTIFGVKSLLAFVSVTLIVAFSHSIIDDAFQISVVTKGLNPRELAPLAIINDVIGFGAPLVAISMVRRFGAPNVLATTLLALAIAYTAFFFAPPLTLVVLLLLFTNLLSDIWTPVADATLHSFIPSSNRATIGSIVNQFSELFSVAGLGIFAWMLGEHSEDLAEAIPDLVEAFSGVTPGTTEATATLFGLPVYDAALVIFAFFGIVAAAILWLFPWNGSARGVALDSPDDLGLTETDI